MKHYKSATARRRVRLGEVLVEAGLITQTQLEQALQSQQATGERLGRVLVSMGLASQDAIAKAIASQLGLEYVNVQTTSIAEDVLTILPEAQIRRHQVLPLRAEGEALAIVLVARCE